MLAHILGLWEREVETSFFRRTGNIQFGTSWLGNFMQELEMCDFELDMDWSACKIRANDSELII